MRHPETAFTILSARKHPLLQPKHWGLQWVYEATSLRSPAGCFSGSAFKAKTRAGAHLRLHFWLTCTYRFLTHLYLQNLKIWLSYTYKGGVGWGGDDNVQVRSKTDLSIHTTKGWGGVGWGGVRMITYRFGARQTWAYIDIRPKGGVGWGC